MKPTRKRENPEQQCKIETLNQNNNKESEKINSTNVSSHIDLKIDFPENPWDSISRVECDEDCKKLGKRIYLGFLITMACLIPIGIAIYVFGINI